MLNSNFDLRYDAGWISAIDLDAVQSAIDDTLHCNVTPNYDLGILYGRQKNYALALQSLQRAVAVRKSDPQVLEGLGWAAFFDDRGRLVVQHAGDFSSYTTQATLLPAAGLGIVVLCNGWPSALREAIPKAFLEMVTNGDTKPGLGERDRDLIGRFAGQRAADLDSIPPGKAASRRGAAAAIGRLHRQILQHHLR